MIAPSYFPRSGGVEKHLLEINRTLTGRGHSVSVLVRYSPDIPEYQENENIRIWRLPEHDSSFGILLWLITHHSIFKGVDVIHSHDYYPRSLRRFISKLAWVHTFHGYEGYPLVENAIKSRQIVRAEVAYCFCVGAFIEKWYGTKCDAIIYGAVNIPTKIHPVPGTWDIIFYGRLENDTGFKDYLEAFNIISKTHPKVSLLVLGRGSLSEWAANFVTKNKLNVEFIDWVTDVLPYLKKSKIAFVSGYLAILEAAAMGKPIIANYQTPIKHDYLDCHPLRANLNISSNPAEIASSFETVLGQLSASSSKINTSQDWALGQSWNKLAELYESSYQRNIDTM